MFVVEGLSCGWCVDVTPCVSFPSWPSDDDDEASLDRGIAAVSPIPKIVTTPIQEDKEEDRNEWGKTTHTYSKTKQKHTRWYEKHTHAHTYSRNRHTHVYSRNRHTHTHRPHLPALPGLIS